MRLDCTGAEPRIDLRDPSLRLTPAQRQALAHDRDLVVTAGAGAGKTTVLALRYVVLLLHLAVRAVHDSPMAPRPDIGAVLVLTFTDKAAQEMAERCYRRLISLSDVIRRDGPDRRSLASSYGEAFPRQLAAALDHLVDTFEAARIGTFHGYCGRILRSHPGPTGTAPDFDILDDVAARELRDRVADHALRAAYSAEPERLRLLANAVGGHGPIREALRHALAHRAVLRPVLTRHAHGEVTIRDLLELFPLTPAQLLHWLDTAGTPVIEEMLDAVALSGGGDSMPPLRALLARIEALLDADDPDALHIASTYHDVLAALCVSDGSKVRRLDWYPFLGTEDRWRAVGMAHRDDAAQRLAAAQELCADWPGRLKLARGLPRAADADMLGALQVLAEVFLDAERRLQAHFEHHGVIDFDALQDRAVAAVTSSAELRASLAAEHRYLMVDEFQDTDARQWALVRALGRPSGEPGDRIFVVGDAKQAIYRFRGGDVSVYRRAMSHIGTEPVVFADNFRSRSGLIDWFNHFFARLMGPPAAPREAFEAPYSPLRAGRGAPGGCVTLAIHDSEGAGADALAEAEATARLIAARILTRCGEFEDLDLPQPGVRGSPPIAILLRTRTHMSSFEAALRRHGVSFVVAKGVSFWSRPEVRDAVNLFDALVTAEPVSVIGALRSPWIGLSDQDIQDLLEGEWGLPQTGEVFTAFGSFELDGFAPPRVLRAARTFARLRAMRDRVPASTFMRRIMQETAAVHAISLHDPSGQAVANVQRLVDRVRELDADGVFLAAEHLVAQVQASAQESEALVPPTDARVVLMTVHASKGLEFPVVIVPGCGTAPRHRASSLTHGSIGESWHVACKALDPDAAVRTRVRTGLHALLSEQDKAEARAESKRLLYVAATRARDHLVLLGTQPRPRRQGHVPTTWSEMLAAVHGVEDADGQRLLVPTGDVAELEPGTRDHLRILDLETWLSLEPGRPAAPPAPAPPDAHAITRLAALPAGAGLEISPSSLDLFVSQPARWYKRVRLGIPDDDTPARTTARANLAAARGEVIHSLLEDDVIDDVERAVARWRARAFREGAPPDLVEEGVPVLLAHLARASRDERVSERILALGMSEVRFRLPIDDVVLNGQIDRLWRAPDGTWVVLDWKSERIRGSVLDAARHHARQLVAYAWAADRILRANGQQGVSKAEVYFTDVGELVSIGPLERSHLEAVEREMLAAGRVGALAWDEVLNLDASALPSLDVAGLELRRLPRIGERAPAPEPAAPPPAPPPHPAAPPPEAPVHDDDEIRVTYDPGFGPADTGVRRNDPYAALRQALGLGAPATGHTPVPPPARTVVPAAPEPPPLDVEYFELDEEPDPEHPWDYGDLVVADSAPSPPVPAEAPVQPVVEDPAAPPVQAPPVRPVVEAPAAPPAQPAPPARPVPSAPTPQVMAEPPPRPDLTDEVPPPTEEEVVRQSARAPEPDTPVPPPIRPRPKRRRRRSRRHEVPKNQLSLFGSPPAPPDDS